MSGPVLWGVPVIATEGLMGLVTRTKTRNYLPSCFTLLRQVGANHANNPTAAFLPDLDEAGLAAILRVPVEEVAKRRHLPRSEAGFVDCLGVAVRADEFLIRTLRFSPTSVGASAHNRVLWSLKMVPCCTESWEYLTSRCSCRAVQRWQTSHRFDRCDRCNKRLSLVAADVVPERLRSGLGFLIGLLDPDQDRRDAARRQLPDQLCDWDGGMVFELALALLPLTSVGYRLKRGMLPAAQDLSTYAESLAQAGELVRGWPDSLVPRLVELVKSRASSKINVRYTGVDAYLAGLESELMPDIVRQAIQKALAPVTAAPGTTPAGQMGMREAALFTGHMEHSLASARRAGQLKTQVCLRANRLLPTLDRTEIEYVADFLQNRRGPDRAASSIGLPQYAIAMIASVDLIETEEHPYLLSAYGPNHVHKDELLRLINRLKAKSVPTFTIKRPIALHRVARGIGGGIKPWGKIFRDLHDRVPFSMTGRSIRGITIDMEYADELRALDLAAGAPHPLGGCSQRDAVEVLNLPLKHIDAIKVGWVGVVDGRFAWRGVQALARERITLAEMSARTGVHGTRLEMMLEREKLPRLDHFGWVRQDVADYVSTISA